ncbi:AbrB/MazE/SpoVT family DNA-binding domain-containing protein [Bifidobacterium sp. ESL0690]|uniref:AbrB/MazE/SpoVT family DNA-binding domain-containing protein n=1 Tax=Bifidobacterium sp. ESL0690 TaxID=2983214 RepID=UPI0023F7A4F1|nr:AbrB/MazE/SpoVT family DNA-binding domain-containing protein [Bifidobacterium sp. ESL0690]WEV46041.1 AbrB/MazE/SpoVT family DNA-binding domain-containing protein [Bifidobacterium sp. ESL0690]
METVTVSQWGNSQAVRLSKSMLERMGVENGDELSVEIQPDGSMVLYPRRKPIRASDLADLFEQDTSGYAATELDTGAPVGSELI